MNRVCPLAALATAARNCPCSRRGATRCERHGSGHEACPRCDQDRLCFGGKHNSASVTKRRVLLKPSRAAIGLVSVLDGEHPAVTGAECYLSRPAPRLIGRPCSMRGAPRRERHGARGAVEAGRTAIRLVPITVPGGEHPASRFFLCQYDDPPGAAIGPGSAPAASVPQRAIGTAHAAIGLASASDSTGTSSVTLRQEGEPLTQRSYSILLLPRASRGAHRALCRRAPRSCSGPALLLPRASRGALRALCRRAPRSGSRLSLSASREPA
ncbi:hypothetical protein T492DRAFT_1096473 [Pavlovales sp. CCMP2436]|nr:hypothetical protein T492DRAFT_1096473 [Pavlovales sp. CCMP2436]